MANKYESRRRALKDGKGRPENPLASLRHGGRGQPVSAPYTPPPPMDRRGLTLALSLGLAVLITALYVQTMGHKFTVCDDNVYVYEKPQIITGLTWKNVVWAFSDAHEGNWHPLTWISHMIDWQVFGTWQEENHRYVDSWPGGHHLVSMIIHCANAVLLFLALRFMTGTLWPSFVVAALFGIHPLRVESVAWAAERKDVLCGLFWMATMLAYAIYARRRPIRDSSPQEAAVTAGVYALVFVFFVLGLLSKSMIVTLPCVLMLLDVWPLGRWKKALRPPGQRDPQPDALAMFLLLVEKIPLLAMVFVDCSITVYGQNKGVALNSFEGLPLSARLLNAVESCGEYLRQTVWPTGLAPFYTHPHMIPDGWTQEFYHRFYLYGALLLLITGAAVWFFRQRPFLAVGWFWYLGTLMPVIGIIQVGTQARADRYTYLPMIGVYLMTAWLLKEIVDRWPQTKIATASICVVALLALSAVTFRQVSYWVDSYKLFQHAVDVTEKNYFAYNHIGIQYDSDAKKLTGIGEKEANQLFDGASENYQDPPKKLDGALLKPLTDAGMAKDFKDFKAAAKKLNIQQKQQLLWDYSADAFQSTIDIKPDYDFGNNNLGVYYARKPSPADLALAEKHFKGALSSNHRYADAFNNLGIILAREGKIDEAIASHIAGLAVRDDRASDHNNLCRAYMLKQDDDAKKGQSAAAEEDHANAMHQNDVALQCDPNFTGAWISRADICMKEANLAEKEKNFAEREKKLAAAAECLRTVVRIDPKSADSIRVRLQVAMIYAQINRFDEAIDMFTQVIDLAGPQPQFFFARGKAYYDRGDWANAEKDFEQVLKLVNSPEAQDYLRRIREKLSNPEKK